jgi:hypothetical protein
MAAKTYYEKLRDPRWQKMRLEVMNRDGFVCQSCFDSESTLNVHHRLYIKGRDPWDYPLAGLVTLCESCHKSEADVSEQLHRLVMALFPYNYNDSAVFEEWAQVMEAAIGPDGLRGNTPDLHIMRDAIAQIVRLHGVGDPLVRALAMRFRREVPVDYGPVSAQED